MRSVRVRILATVLVLGVVGVGAWQLMPDAEADAKPIVVGTSDVVTSLDPAGAYDAGSWAVFSNVFQTLTTYQPGSTQPVPDAAEECGFNGDDAKVYVCELREGLRFPSGREMTAEDVKFSFERVLKIDSEVGPASLFSTLRSVEADGREVTFRLSSADATFPFKVATGAASIVDSEAYPADELRGGTGVDGTGPYRLTSYEEGEEAVLVPNPDYRGAVEDRATPVTLRYFTDSAALDEAWKNRAIDVASRELPPETLAGMSPADPDHRISESDGSSTNNLVLDVRPGTPLADPSVRRAMAWLIDRDKIAATVLDGTVEPLYSLIPAGFTGHNTAFFDAFPERDADKARELLERAGVRTPVPVSLGFPRIGTREKEAYELKEQLEAEGLFLVKLEGREWNAFQKDYAKGEFDAYTLGWIADYPDPDNFSAALIGTGNSMKNGFGDKRIDELILRSQSFGDRTRAVRTFEELQKLTAEKVPMIPLWQRKEYTVTSKDVGGGQFLNDGTGVFRLWRLGWL
ncbi:ABC transporter substrate-binding protein [Streptomyces sp. MJP52]|uniref:ABC transporter substrate-binding protein n=1 Tax=Streptomyces sp. MJP52 TaxID=2940555 RepID=UPI002473E064|nr:ABC transporter substrate-binding protein [Streptomyces sp. MJP52]MDH6225410.1 peptide/nickel transport system substrate-binding protein [Streptomyces sp. MJP52]